MKANMWEFNGIGELSCLMQLMMILINHTTGTGDSMDRIDNEVSELLESTFRYFAQQRSLGSTESVEELISTRKFKPYDTRTQGLPTLE